MGGKRVSLRLLGRGGVLLEGTRRSELAELVTHHVFGHVDRDESFTVVNLEVHADERRRHGGAARPSFDRLAIVGLLGGFNFVH